MNILPKLFMALFSGFEGVLKVFFSQQGQFLVIDFALGRQTVYSWLSKYQR